MRFGQSKVYPNTYFALLNADEFLPSDGGWLQDESDRLRMKVDGYLMMERFKSSEEQDRDTMIYPRNNDNKMLLNSVSGCPPRKGKSPHIFSMNHKTFSLDHDGFSFHINHPYTYIYL